VPRGHQLAEVKAVHLVPQRRKVAEVQDLVPRERDEGMKS
jgi:hypothetical protein